MTATATQLKVPLLNIRRQTESIRAELDAAIGAVLNHGQFILGPEVRALEERVAEYCGTRFAVSCASGSDAIMLALMALGVGPGDAVVTSPFTFFATAGYIAHVGARPIFIDIDPDTFNIDPERLTQYLDSRSAVELRTIKAILPVHLFGQCAEMGAINATAGRHGIAVVEDAAQAIGAEYDGARAGSLGLCGCFSFFPSKNLGGFGDGGLITTDDSDFAEKLKILRNHGSRTKYFHEKAGVNSRLDSLQAAILLVKLRHLENWTSKRRLNAEFYREQLTRRLGARVKLPIENVNGRHVYNQYTIRTPHRDRVRERLAEAGIASEVYYPLALHQQECFAGLGYRAGDFPYAEAAAKEVLSIPIEAELNSDERAAVVEALADTVPAVDASRD